MILSTLAQDKAKYKTMFKDWLVALCLVIFMHFFMISILHISSLITDALDGEHTNNTNIVSGLSRDIIGILNSGDDGYKYDNGTETMDIGDAYAKIFVMGGIIVYTVIFAVKYLKREFTIIFLTIVGPAACITYPIDKIGDGKAQAYNRWFTEYLYQVIIQPFHLLLYIVLIGTAADMANHNILYSLVCFAVMGPAEKFIKEMFGFKDKLGSPLGTMMKAGMARDMVSKATSRLMGGKGGNSGVRGSNVENNNALPQRPATRNIENSLLGSPDNSGGGNTQMASGDRNNLGTTNNPENQQNNTLQQGNRNNIEGQNDPNQTMLEAYDENYGTDAWNAQERDALARENNDSNGMQYSNNEYEQILRESGYSDEEIAGMMQDAPQMAGDAAGIATIQEAENQSEGNNDGTEGDRTQENQERQRQLEQALNRQQNEQENINAYRGNWRSIHAQRMAKKYGTTSRKKRWARRLGRGAKNGVRALAKGTLIAGAATIGAGVALATGNGAEAAAILGGTATLGLRSGMKTIKGVAKSASNATKDYYRNDAIPGVSRFANYMGLTDRTEREFREFESNPDELNKAILSYRKNHDGANPSYIDLQNEMQDRFALSQLKLNDNQIDNAIGTYQTLRDDGMDEQMALNQAAFAAQLVDRYSAKDFGNEKTMKEAIETIANSRNISRQDALQHLQRASKMKGVDMVKLPEQTRTVDVNTQPEIPSWVGNLGIDTGSLTEANIEQITRLNVRIHETGFDEGQLRLLAGNIDRQGSSSEIITNFENKIETSAEYINNPSLRNDAERYLQNSGEAVTRENVDSEMRERLVLSDTFNITNKKDLNAMRDLEKRTPRTKTQKQVAREMAIATRGLSDVQKKAAEKKLTEQLTDGGTSATQAATDARNVMDLAEMYNTYQMPQ